MRGPGMSLTRLDFRRYMTAEMSVTALALRARIYIGERDHHGHQPLYTAIVDAARNGGLRGATVLKAIEGYRVHSIVHAARVVDLAPDLPIVVELIDQSDRIEAFLPELFGMLHGGLVTVGPVQILYGGDSTR